MHALTHLLIDPRIWDAANQLRSETTSRTQELRHWEPWKGSLLSSQLPGHPDRSPTHLLSWERCLNAGASGCGLLACSQSWCPCTPEGLTGPFLQRALPRCRRNGQVRENSLTPRLGERVFFWRHPRTHCSERAEQGTDREGLGSWWGCRRRRPRPRPPAGHPVTGDLSTLYPEPHPSGILSHLTASDTSARFAFTLPCSHRTMLFWPKTHNSQQLQPQFKPTHPSQLNRPISATPPPSSMLGPAYPQAGCSGSKEGLSVQNGGGWDLALYSK